VNSRAKAADRKSGGLRYQERGIKPFLFSPFKAILTTRVTVKFGSQGIGENRRDLPACCCTPHRKIDGFIGNLTEQSQEGTPWRQAVDSARREAPGA
jgi:hypothetical protein